MTNYEIECIVENDREWRKYIVKKLLHIEEIQVKQGLLIERQRAWNWIFRGGFALIVSVVLLLVQSKIGG